ncbi:GtrA family protein [Salidesulfovibrio brasiliensis]|uniref:GtrA family protein n=1 Tax=Salidesulfovibrio brasiliensis TaxID=221711 RepID=UPI0006D1F2BA|nr:GtrA family protein [Salidesulfovibrio brasiliensis]
MRRLLTGSFARYCVGGALGFAVDAGIVLLLEQLAMDPFTSRVFSIIIAIAVTWVYHRNVTFTPAGDGILKELGRYYVSNALGAGVNYTVYSAWLILFAPKHLIIPLAVASIVALAFNYVMAKFFVFRAKKVASGSRMKRQR